MNERQRCMKWERTGGESRSDKASYVKCCICIKTIKQLQQQKQQPVGWAPARLWGRPPLRMEVFTAVAGLMPLITPLMNALESEECSNKETRAVSKYEWVSVLSVCLQACVCLYVCFSHASVHVFTLFMLIWWIPKLFVLLNWSSNVFHC